MKRRELKAPRRDACRSGTSWRDFAANRVSSGDSSTSNCAPITPYSHSPCRGTCWVSCASYTSGVTNTFSFFISSVGLASAEAWCAGLVQASMIRSSLNNERDTMCKACLSHKGLENATYFLTVTILVARYPRRLPAYCLDSEAHCIVTCYQLPVWY